MSGLPLDLKGKMNSMPFRIAFLVALLVSVLSVPVFGMGRRPPEPAYVPGQILVRFHADIGREQADDIVREEGGETRSILGRTGVYLVVLPEGTDVMEAADRFSARPEVRYAEPNFRVEKLEP